MAGLGQGNAMAPLLDSNNVNDSMAVRMHQHRPWMVRGARRWAWVMIWGGGEGVRDVLLVVMVVCPVEHPVFRRW
jgi:hypothetical protein